MIEDSLQDRKHTGGLYGARGYEFEKAYILSRLPDWLISVDLEFFQQELWSDLELFFSSGRRWLIQIKNHTLELTEFRDILFDFQTRHEANQDRYEKYVIISTGVTNSVREIQNLLERWRAIEHLGEPELTNTKLQDISKLNEHGLVEFAEFIFANASKLQIIGDAGWVNDESRVRKIFISSLNTACKVSRQDAENLYFRIAQHLANERGSRIDLQPFRDELSKFATSESLSSLPPFILPQLDVASFTGRSDELLLLEDLLLKPDMVRLCSIVGLAGSGGIGKSALACHFAMQHKDVFPEGVIGLRVDGKDKDVIAREFARLCGEEVDPEDERDAGTIMQEIFGHRRMLLIFDNAEDASIQALCPGGKRCAIIITTRDRQLPFLLGVPEEGRIDLPPLIRDDALILLSDLIGGERVTTEASAADVVLDLIGNLPLAIQIVGATLQMQPGRSIQNYADSLAEERQRLKQLRIRGALHLDVRASFSLSLKLFEDPEIDFFASLSVCAQDGFSVHTAMATGDCNESQAYEWLGYLYRLSLLNRPQLGINRFVFHPLLRAFAHEIAIERSLKDKIAERHARYFIEFAKSNDVNDPRVAIFLAEELDDIVLAAEWLQGQEISDYSFIINLQPFLQQHGYWQQATSLMEGFLLSAERKEDWRAVVQLRIQQAKYLSLLGDWIRAESVLLPIRDTIERIGEPEARQRAETMWLNTLGGVLQRQGRFDQAVENFQRSAVIEEQLGNLRGQAKVLNSLGGVLQRRGDFEGAAKAFRQSAQIEENTGNRRGQAMMLNSLGGVLQREGHFGEAADAFQRSYDLLVLSGDQRGQAMVLNSLGGVFQRQGHFNEAIQFLERSAEIEEKIGNQRGQAMVLTSLGGVLQRQGCFDEAIEVLRDSARIEAALGNQRGQAMVLNSLGGVFRRQGKFDGAADVFQRSYDLLVLLDDQRGQAMVLNSLGGVFQRQGHFDEAVNAFRRSVKIGEFLNDKRHVAIALNSLGGILQRQGKFEEAIEVLQRSAEIEKEIGDQRGLAMVLNSLGGVFQRQGLFIESLRSFQASYAISKESNDLVSLAMVHFGLGKARFALGEVEESVSEFRRSFEINESLMIQRGISIVTPLLIQSLQKLGRTEEAIDYCRRALLIAPEDSRMQRLNGQISKADSSHKVPIVQGSVKLLRTHAKGHRYGFIVPDDRQDQEVYFQERDVSRDSLRDLTVGARVEFEVGQGFKGPQAREVRILR
jgi:tetratricopeptide (TPR) repeat protein/cold shock CspA family protein